jgi:serine/threonine protein kinase
MNGMTQTKYDQTDALKTRPIRSMFPQSMDPTVQAKEAAKQKGKLESLIRSQQNVARQKAKEVSTVKNQCANIQLHDKSSTYPHFTRNELIFGPMLGSGSFCTIFEIVGMVNIGPDGRALHSSLPTKPSTTTTAMAPHPSNFDGEKNKLHSSNPHNGPRRIREMEKKDGSKTMDRTDDTEEEDAQAQGRLFMAQNCLRQKTGEARYALKKISPASTRDPSHFMQSMIDMATETRLLSSIGYHPNIIKLRAVSAHYDPFDEQSFIIVDRLYDTLEERIQTWQSRNFRDRLVFVGAQSRRKKRLNQQLLAAHDLASAVRYLHQKNVIHRDLKQQNIGYNIRGDLVLFDFGLSRELPTNPSSESKENDDRGLYHMTGFIGSYRYMAPEVGRKEKYNEKSDVYGFAILCWEIFTMKRSFLGHSVDTLKTKVWNGPHLRPNTLGKDGTDRTVMPIPIPSSVNKSIQTMIERAWDHDIVSRPTMDEILVILKEECLDTNIDVSIPSGLALQRLGSDYDTSSKRQHSYIRRRSTHVMEPLNVIQDDR